MSNNNISNWFTNQLVTENEMNALSQDLYQRFTAITECSTGIILSLAGNITQLAGNVTIPAGSFRFPDSTESYLPFTTGIFGNTAGATVAVTGNGFIVARYSISPTTINQTNYTISVSYLFVTSVVTLTDCIICVITSGVISGYGTYLIYLPATNLQAIAGTASNVALTPANVASIFTANKAVALQGTESGGVQWLAEYSVVNSTITIDFTLTWVQSSPTNLWYLSTPIEFYFAPIITALAPTRTINYTTTGPSGFISISQATTTIGISDMETGISSIDFTGAVPIMQVTWTASASGTMIGTWRFVLYLN